MQCRKNKSRKNVIKNYFKTNYFWLLLNWL